jgi:hypothetical protein
MPQRTGAAGVLRRYDDEMAAVPGELVRQLAAELVPALIEDGFVQAGLGPNVFPRRIYCACRRLGHIPHSQVLDADDRVVFADRGRGLVQKVAADVGDAGIDSLHSRLGFFQLLLNLTLRLKDCWALRKATSCRLKLLRGA